MGYPVYKHKSHRWMGCHIYKHKSRRWMGCPAMDGEVLFTNINHVDKWDVLFLHTAHPTHLRDLCL
jgi:hypothetical protein